jgi:hypothetical protein
MYSIPCLKVYDEDLSLETIRDNETGVFYYTQLDCLVCMVDGDSAIFLGRAGGLRYTEGTGKDTAG